MKKLLIATTLAAFLALGASSHPWKVRNSTIANETGPFEMHQFDSIEKDLKQLSQGSLLILDCSKTLVIPKDPVLKAGHWGKILERALGRIPELHELRRLKLLVELQAEKELVHPRWPSLLSELAERGVHILVLTKHPTGEQIPGFPSFEKIRVDHLFDLGFRFDRWAPGIDFEALQMALPGREIGWHKGIMFAPDGEKGPVIEALLEHIKDPVSEVVIVDDSFAQAQSMANALRRLTIPSRVLLFRDENAQHSPTLTPDDEQRLREFLSSGVWSK